MSKKIIISTLLPFLVLIGGLGHEVKPKIMVTQYLLTEHIILTVNAQRISEGLKPLERSEKLCKVATIRAEEISLNFSHERTSGETVGKLLTEEKIKWKRCGENLAKCKTESAEKIVSAWMSSSSHRKNILEKDFTKIGIGIYKKSETYYIVAIFT